MQGGQCYLHPFIVSLFTGNGSTLPRHERSSRCNLISRWKHNSRKNRITIQLLFTRLESQLAPSFATQLGGRKYKQPCKSSESLEGAVRAGFCSYKLLSRKIRPSKEPKQDCEERSETGPSPPQEYHHHVFSVGSNYTYRATHEYARSLVIFCILKSYL